MPSDHNGSLSKYQYEKMKLTLPKLKGKYNPVDGVSNRVLWYNKIVL